MIEGVLHVEFLDSCGEAVKEGFLDSAGILKVAFLEVVRVFCVSVGGQGEMCFVALLPLEIGDSLGVYKVGGFEEGGAAGMFAVSGFLSHGAA